MGPIASIFSFPKVTGDKGMKSQRFVLMQWAELTDWATQLCFAELPQGRKLSLWHTFLAASCKHFFLIKRRNWRYKNTELVPNYKHTYWTPWLKHFSDTLVNDNRRQNCSTTVLLVCYYPEFTFYSYSSLMLFQLGYLFSFNLHLFYKAIQLLF